MSTATAARVETVAHAEEGRGFLSRKKSEVDTGGEGDSEAASFEQVRIPLGLNRWIYLLIGAITVIVFGPLVVNWGEIQDLLEKESVYSALCVGGDENATVNEKGVCTLQEEALDRLGITAQCMFFTGALVGGLTVDQFGPRVAGIVGGVGFVLSYLMLAISSSKVNTYYAYGIIQGFSVEFAFYSVISIPNLFPKNRALILSVIGAARSAAMLLCTLFNKVRTDKFTVNSIGWMMMGVCFALLIFLAVFLPNQAFLVTDENGKLVEKPGKPTKEEYKRWAVTVGQPFYCIWLLTYAIVLSRGQFHIISLGTQHPDVKSAFGYLAGLSFVPCPLLGLLVDWVGAMPVVFGLNILGLISYICLISGKNLGAQWIAVLLLTVLLSFLASQSYVLIQERYMGKYVGKLCGLVTCLGGLYSFTNIKINSWAKLGGKMKQADIIFLALTGLTLGTMAILWWGHPILFRNPCFPDRPSALILLKEEKEAEETEI